jgi:hypothetical protein
MPLIGNAKLADIETITVIARHRRQGFAFQFRRFRRSGDFGNFPNPRLSVLIRGKILVFSVSPW